MGKFTETESGRVDTRVARRREWAVTIPWNSVSVQDGEKFLEIEVVVVVQQQELGDVTELYT